MKPVWLKGCKTPEDKEQRKQLLNSAMHGLEILMVVMQEDLKTIQAVPKKDYDSASWAYRQADANGSARVLTRYIKLIKELEND